MVSEFLYSVCVGISFLTFNLVTRKENIRLQKVNMYLRARVSRMWSGSNGLGISVFSLYWHQYIFWFSIKVFIQWHVTFSQSIPSLREALFSCWTVCTMECNFSEFVPSLKDAGSLFSFCLTKLSVTCVSNYYTRVTTELESMWKELVVAWWEVLCWHLHGSNIENHDTYLPS